MVTGEGEHLRRFFILNHSIVRKNGQFFISSHLTPRVTYIDFYTTEAKTAKRHQFQKRSQKIYFVYHATVPSGNKFQINND